MKKNNNIKKVMFIIVLFILIFLNFGWYSVSGNSMNPIIKNKDIIFIQKFFKNYNYGNIIVFQKNNINMVKRIIGKGGDKISIIDGHVFKNDIILKEDYISSKTMVLGKTDMVIFNVPKNHFFVMGDNRKYSTDSRECFNNQCDGYTDAKHFVSKNEIKGKILFK